MPARATHGSSCVVNAIEDYLASRRRGRAAPVLASRSMLAAEVRRQLAAVVLPAVRGALGAPNRVVLHVDEGDRVLHALADARMPELVRRGMATPEHILRAGRLPVWLGIDASAAPDAIAGAVRTQLASQRTEYEAYHTRHAAPGERPLDDWAKVVLVPGLGMITASRDKRGAITASVCYRAVIETIANAELIDTFRFIAESDVFEFEHWPLERRKIDEQDSRERATLLLPRHVAVVIGGGSGIGKASALRFAKEGAHVVVADLDGPAAEAVAAEICRTNKDRAIGVALDVRDDASLAELVQRTVLTFGGIDSLFYTAGQAPRFARVTALRRDDLQRQFDVHYVGAVLAVGAVASVMQRQQLGGSIVASVSKAALAPGRDAAAYGGSKAALLQAMRGRRRRARQRRHSRQRHQRRPGGDAALPAVRTRTRRHARRHTGTAVGGVPRAQRHGRVADSGRGGGGRRGAAGERAVPLYDRRHHHDRRRPVGGVSKVTIEADPNRGLRLTETTVADPRTVAPRATPAGACRPWRR